jgi:citrate synthase
VILPKGLDGVAVTETRIAKSDPDGSLVYRGYAIGDLAANATFEETAYLIIRGSLPTKEELGSFSSSLRSKAVVDPRILAIMKLLPQSSHPMDVLRTCVSALGSLDVEPTEWERQLSIAAKMAVLVANCQRVPKGLEVAQPGTGLSFAADLLRMITGSRPSAFDVWVFERTLILYLEHDLNASSFTVRVVASTAADPYAAVTAGLAALKGPLHGGANEAAMQMLLEVKEPERAVAYVDKALKEGRKLMGFGHRVYRQFDPRARLCKEYLAQMIARRGSDDKLFRLCDVLEKEMWERKKIPPNLDFYTAPIFYLLGIPIPLYTPIFASSRVFGWISHYNEQVRENKLIRPDAVYVGPTGLKFVPLERR